MDILLPPLQLREQALKRDHWCCQPCLALNRIVRATTVEPIIGTAKGGTDTVDNLRSVCDACARLTAE